MMIGKYRPVCFAYAFEWKVLLFVIKFNLFLEETVLYETSISKMWCGIYFQC